MKKLLKQTVRNCNIFVIHDKKLKIDIEDVSLLTPPILFKEFIDQIYKISDKNGKLNNLIKLNNFLFNFKNYELIFDNTNEKIRLTELEARLLKFLSENTMGSTKRELLSKVWGHNKVLDTHTLESLIYRLRKKIEINPNQPKILILKEKKYFLIKN